MNGWVLVAVLIGVGALPLLPLTLAKASRSPRAALRVPARVLAFVLLYVCFLATSGGLLAGFVMLFGALGDAVILAATAVFLIAGAWLSHRVVFGAGSVAAVAFAIVSLPGCAANSLGRSAAENAGDAAAWDSLHDKLCTKDPQCCSYDGDTSPRSLIAHELDANATLLFLACSTMGYNSEASLWLMRPGSEPAPAMFAAISEELRTATSPAGPPAPDGQPSWLTSPWYDGKLHSLFCARGICDAGTQVDYAWDGRAFRVSRVRGRSDDCCDELEDVGAWPILWPEAERCTYAWRIREGSVELVTQSAGSERVHAVEDLPAPCSTSGQGLVLSCAENNVPVTSQNDDWVVWQRSGSLVEPGEARVHKRVPRGCTL